MTFLVNYKNFQKDYDVYVNTTFSKTFTYYDASGSAVDLTQYDSLNFSVYVVDYEDAEIDKTISTVQGSNTEAEMRLEQSDTSNLIRDNWYYYVVYADLNNERTIIQSGRLHTRD